MKFQVRLCVLLVLATPLMVSAQPAAQPAATAPLISTMEMTDRLHISIDAKLFTTYRFKPTEDDPEWHRPYFFPVMSAEGTHLTADRAAETRGDANREHPWHRSVWVGHGDINGIDHWTHPTSGKKLQRHLKFTRIDPNGFVEELAWDGREEGKPVLLETRTVKFIAYADGARGIDVTSKFTAASGDAVFQVKPLNVSGVEGGWLAARVPIMLSTHNDSVITTSAGAVGERQARSTPGVWCDYSGLIDTNVFGTALFDHPSNPGHPAPFHVRAWGLLTHLGTHDWTLPASQSRTLRHMLLFHPGDAKSAQLEERFREFSQRQ